MSDTDCIFCQIIAGEIPTTMVVETETIVAFRDIAPQAPTHVLVVPRRHLADVTDLAADAPDVMAEMIEVAQRIADDECEGQFRLIFNTGLRTGQSVFHVHGHVIGGADLGWSPA
ncbi:MAG: histidine triad nucleotide-binding protein [Demequinaceae bacterium]|nr:histidine triad nucleotide-binding protein [Demequinaceae bacterium]